MRLLAVMAIAMVATMGLCETANAQKCGVVNPQNRIVMRTALPFAQSGTIFNENYSGIFNAEFGLTRRSASGPMLFGIGANYTAFQHDNSDTRLRIIAPTLELGFEIIVGKHIAIVPSMQGGYSFMQFTEPGEQANTTKYDENAFHVEPTVAFEIRLTEKVGIGLFGGYRMIFEAFGNQLDNQDILTRFLRTGIGFTFRV